jgi:hypothetical protein
MAQLSSVVEPYGEVNVFAEADGSIRVNATILMKPDVEGAQTGLAIDGSRSMADNFGGQVAVSSLFGSKSNLVQPVARTMADYLANFDSDGETSVIYWACGNFGKEIEILGDMDSQTALAADFATPSNMGTGTKLMPAIKYYTEDRFPKCPWGIYLFVTDGLIEDIDEVKAYTDQLCKQIASSERGFTKLVLIGLGQDFFYKHETTGERLNPTQAESRLVELDNDSSWEKSSAWQVLEDLDDLHDEGGEFEPVIGPDGESIDIWDYKLASSMNSLEEIFAEVVSRNMIIAPSAEIIDSNGAPAKPIGRDSYMDGLPALLDFHLSAGSTSFTLRLPNGNEIIQPIGDVK